MNRMTYERLEQLKGLGLTGGALELLQALKAEREYANGLDTQLHHDPKYKLAAEAEAAEVDRRGAEITRLTEGMKELAEKWRKIHCGEQRCKDTFNGCSTELDKLRKQENGA